MPRGKSVRTIRARDAFCGVLAKTCNVTAAAEAAGIGRSTAYQWRAADPDFAQAWSDAEEAAADQLEQVAFERATGGQSDRMLEILLKAHRPKYREKQEIDITSGGNRLGLEGFYGNRDEGAGE